MSFIDTLRRARALLREERRLSLRALKRELGLDDDEIGEITDELVDAQRVAILERSVLVWVGEEEEPAAPREAAAVPPRNPRSYTPKHLADKILQSKSALEGERKQVTVLFADVKGSMELAEQIDPEAWHAVLERFFQILTEGVHRFEGTVNQYTGRWDHGAVRCADRARGPRAAGLLRGAAPARHSARARPGAAPRVRPGLPDARRPQLGRCDRRQDRRRPAHGLHRTGSHRGPGAAHGAARRGGQALPDRRHRPLGPGLLRDRGPGRVPGQGRRRARARLRPRGPGRAAHALRPLACTRPLALRRARRRERPARRRPRARHRGERPGDRHRGGGGHGQEPPLLRVHRALPRERPPGVGGAWACPRPHRPAAPHARDVPQPLRDRPNGRRPRRAREDRRCAAAAGPLLRRRASPALRLPRSTRPRAPRASAGPRASPAPDPRDLPADRPRGHTLAHRREPDRGPALARRGERRVRGRPGRPDPLHVRAGAAELPPRVRGRVDDAPHLPAAHARATRPGGRA